MTKLAGVHVAMCTPFADDERLDEGRMREHIDYLIDAGVHGIVLNSGTGEFAYLGEAEAQRVIEVGTAHVAGRVTVTAQTSTVSLRGCIEKTKAAIEAGVDAVMVLPPWLDGPFADGMMHHYLSLADAVDTTLVLYNIPQESGIEMTPAMWAELSQHPNVGHIKDSTGDLPKMQQLIAAGPGVLGGCDPVAPFALMAGADGWIWGAANVMPKRCVQLYELIAGGNHHRAMELWLTEMQPFNSFIWDNTHRAGYIPSVKAATAMITSPLGPCRQPQLPLSEEATESLVATIAPLLSPTNPS